MYCRVLWLIQNHGKNCQKKIDLCVVMDELHIVNLLVQGPYMSFLSYLTYITFLTYMTSGI